MVSAGDSANCATFWCAEGRRCHTPRLRLPFLVLARRAGWNERRKLRVDRGSEVGWK